MSPHNQPGPGRLPPAQREVDVLIVGGGVVGLACAYYAQRVGRSACVLDVSTPGRGASWGNAGLVPLSAAVPLSGPGVIAKSLRWMLEPDGAFRLRPRADVAFVRWLLEFRRHCQLDRARETTARLVGLVRQSAALLEELQREENVDFEYARSGTLAACRTEAELQGVTARDGVLRDLGVECRTVGAEAAIGMEPSLSSSVIGAVHYPGDAHLNPGRLTSSLEQVVRRRGAAVLAGVGVERLTCKGRRVTGVATTAGEIRAGEVVVAAGMGSRGLLRRAEIDVLIEPGKGYHLEFDGLPPLRHVVRLPDAKVVASGIGSALRVTGKLELTDSARISRRRIVEGLARLARQGLVLPAGARPSRTWCGLRPMTPDSLPYIGRPGRRSNLVIATGHGQLGVALAPITGALVADLLAGGQARVPLEPFRVERFDA